jgi:hypothetical protein
MSSRQLLSRRALISAAAAAISPLRASDARLAGSALREDPSGWTFVRLQGPPAQIGFQHGYLLAARILDGFEAIQLYATHETEKPWSYYRDAARQMLWPKVEEEYRQELQGIVEGLKAREIGLDLWDVVAMNAWMELAWYYVPWDNKRRGQSTPASVAVQEHCSAFLATGSYTRDGRIVAAHNAWIDYLVGSRWTILFDIRPTRGHRVFMDGFPGLIHSADDFAINAKGIVLTETTISAFEGFDPEGIPEFVRARKAIQHGSTIDQVVDIFKRGNNGGYANNWLIADRNTNEIASLELGLKNVTLERTRDGYMLGSNCPMNSRLLREETPSFDINDKSLSGTARRERWLTLMQEHKGKIDIEAAKRFLADGYDSFERKLQPGERTLCGRIDLSPRGSKGWQQEFGPAGAVQNKATDHALSGDLAMWAAAGPLCGPPFTAADFLREHPRYAWQAPKLKDLPRGPWKLFRAEG